MIRRTCVGYFYAIAGAIYFITSGLLAIRDIPAKMERIGLQATNADGQTAFIIIYFGLMAGTGISALLLLWFSKKWQYATLLISSMICAILVSRLIAIGIVDQASEKQYMYMAAEFVMLLPGFVMIWFDKHQKR